MTQQYIFDAEWRIVSELFYLKLDTLHEKCQKGLVLNGIAPNGTGLESIKMTKSPKVKTKYCEKVVGGLTNIKPEIIAKLVEDGKSKIECIFTKIDDEDSINNFYMIQNIIDWPLETNFSCQVWFLGDTSKEEIEEIWS